MSEHCDVSKRVDGRASGPLGHSLTGPLAQYLRLDSWLFWTIVERKKSDESSMNATCLRKDGRKIELGKATLARDGAIDGASLW